MKTERNKHVIAVIYAILPLVIHVVIVIAPAATIMKDVVIAVNQGNLCCFN